MKGKKYPQRIFRLDGVEINDEISFQENPISTLDILYISSGENFYANVDNDKTTKIHSQATDNNIINITEEVKVINISEVQNISEKMNFLEQAKNSQPEEDLKKHNTSVEVKDSREDMSKKIVIPDIDASVIITEKSNKKKKKNNSKLVDKFAEDEELTKSSVNYIKNNIVIEKNSDDSNYEVDGNNMLNFEVNVGENDDNSDDNNDNNDNNDEYEWEIA
jgi:hypothetical protein